MKTKDLKETFNELVKTLQRWELYQPEDEVDNALTELSNKIDEINLRVDCAVRSNSEYKNQMTKFTNGFQNHGLLMQLISYEDWEVAQRGVNDVHIALDFKDTEPIDNDWYGLFGTRNGVEEKPINETIEDTVESSSGGIPYRICKHCSIKEEETVMNLVDGFWLCCDCNPQTELCKNKDKHEIVKDIISKLKDINVDGETMDYIVKELGFEEYLLRSLIMNSDYKDTKDLVREKFEISL